MNKSSNLDDVFPESCGQVEPRYTSEGEWTWEGKPKSAKAIVGATESNRYCGTCMNVHG